MRIYVEPSKAIRVVRMIMRFCATHFAYVTTPKPSKIIVKVTEFVGNSGLKTTTIDISFELDVHPFRDYIDYNDGYAPVIKRVKQYFPSYLLYDVNKLPPWAVSLPEEYYFRMEGHYNEDKNVYEITTHMSKSFLCQ